MSKFPMVEVKDLRKIYSGQVVLNEINLHFYPGQFVALVGKNGSGKSTMMRMLSKREIFDGGDILFQNQSLLSPRVKYLSDVVFITEEQTLPIQNDILWWKSEYQSLSSYYDEACFELLVKELRVDVNKRFTELSRGQKMKALFALQAPRHPKIYLLDEMTSVLDSGSRWTLMAFLKKEAEKGSLVIMSTNIAGEMQGFANSLVALEYGNLELAAPANELGTFFEKYRVVADSESELKNLEAHGARRIMSNIDGSWSLLRKKAGEAPLQVLDRREVSIEDVATYYTITGSEMQND
jgi:ABC-type multidrug transport system ATPase subunit